jgi:hypothetical protein
VLVALAEEAAGDSLDAPRVGLDRAGSGHLLGAELGDGTEARVRTQRPEPGLGAELVDPGDEGADLPETPIENCQGLQAALATLFDSTPDARSVVLLEPGVYYCESTVFVPEWVSVRGIGGRAKTQIWGEVENSIVGLVHLFGGCERRGVEVRKLAASLDQGAIAVSIWRFGGAAEARLREVRLIGGAGVNAHEVGAIAVFVPTWDAILEGPAHGKDSVLELEYSVLSSVVLAGTSSKTCRFTRLDSGTRLDRDCLP